MNPIVDPERTAATEETAACLENDKPTAEEVEVTPDSKLLL